VGRGIGSGDGEGMCTGPGVGIFGQAGSDSFENARALARDILMREAVGGLNIGAVDATSQNEEAF
jgi:hypothetical protein